MRVLILGGTTEARALAERLEGHPRIGAVLSLAGRTQSPVLPHLPVRIGGFGGAEGLARHLRGEAVAALVDATHPFAERMSRNAMLACAATGTLLLVLSRPPWTVCAADHWIDTGDMDEAVMRLGSATRRVFLTVGRLQVAAFESAPHHHYVIRSIDPPDPAPNLPRHVVILARPPFNVADEEDFMRRQAVEVLVTKNSGGAATYAKIAAARNLGLPVVMVRQPARPAATLFTDPDAVVTALEALGAAASGAKWV